jgi:primosomal protein N''
MARPQRSTLQQIEDAFSNMDLASQEKLLATLAALHRFTARQDAKTSRAKTKPTEPKADDPADAPLLEGQKP